MKITGYIESGEGKKGKICPTTSILDNLHSANGIATGYGLGRSRDRISVGNEIFRTCPDRPWGPPSFLYNG